ncbi:rhodanese-like domain-containing protein [Limibaculum sp. FT325]|uniref:rhodanese-like domain-containing protein n=1 Tax=Thermohalobaculum sediminis TaxID=2939436 RepID=UPI0020BFE377|nr:rhodanese-like domain-containing protein [Limibaculum sediminis]MCL5775507.1 rhodanese-like domain-containing protein [Limibaculum sediminis]
MGPRGTLRALMLAGAAIAALATAAPGRAQGRDDAGAASLSVERMSAEAAYRLAAEGKIVLIDIRPAEGWAALGVPEGAETVDFYDPMFYEMVDIFVDGDHDKPVALICNTGGRSEHAALELRARGYTRTIDVAEGIRGSSAGPGWIERGLPMSKPR